MKRLALLFLLCLTSVGLGWANTALILISPAAAGPTVDPNTYVHRTWVLWPSANNVEGSNRLLSLSTGMDWHGEGNDLAFKEATDGWISQNFRSLVGRGVLPESAPAFVAGPKGEISYAGLLLSLSRQNPLVKVWPFETKQFPPGELVFEARNWDEVQEFRSRIQGRCMVLEYPPAADRPWTRYWLFSSGQSISDTPEDREVRIPGIVPAKNALSLIRTQVKLAAPNASRPGGHQVLEVLYTQRTQNLVVFGGIGLLILIPCLICYAREIRQPLLSKALLTLACFPMAIELAQGMITETGGPGMWVYVSGCLVLLSLVFWSGKRLKVTAAALLIYVIYGDRGHLPFQLVPHEVFMALAMMGLVVLTQSIQQLWVRISILISYTMIFFVKGPELTIVPVGALVVLGGGPLIWVLVATFIEPTAWYKVFSRGLTYLPNNQPYAAKDVGGLNIWPLSQFFMSPLFVIFGMTCLGCGLFGGGFMWHRMKRDIRSHPDLYALFVFSGLLALFSIMHPIYWTSAVASLIFSVGATLHYGLQE